MKHVKEFNRFNQNECIIIMGLPGSGKTTLAKKIQKENPKKNYQIFDDFQRIKSLEFVGKINMIISNSMLIKHGLSQYEKICEETNSKLEVIWFENNPEQCLKNMNTRWYKMNSEDKSLNKHQDPKVLKEELLNFSKIYHIPDNTKTIPVFKL